MPSRSLQHVAEFSTGERSWQTAARSGSNQVLRPAMAEPVEEMPGRRQFRVERGWLQVRQAVHPAVHAPVEGFYALRHLRNAECVDVIWRDFTGQGGVQQGSDGSEVGLPGVLGLASVAIVGGSTQATEAARC